MNLTRQNVIFLFICLFNVSFLFGIFALDNQIKCDSKIFCTGELLHKIQMSSIFKDSKTFVDMPTRLSENKVLENFAKLDQQPTKAELESFLNENFHQLGYDVISETPQDWHEDIDLLKNIKDQNLVKFVRALHLKWKNLIKKFDSTRICDGCVSSAITANNSFVVPGGRFIEYYYWDTYWAIEGLLISEMQQTVKGVIRNFLDMVRTYGFVPNGARIYYLNRSQPPLLTQMVYLYFKKTNDLEFLNEAIPYLDKEYLFWINEKSVNYTIDGIVYTLNWYQVNSTEPRPESYKEDYLNGQNSTNEKLYYSNIITAAESGWDFSSRWFTNAFDIRSIKITSIIPIDLNSILLKNEKCLSELHKKINSTKWLFYDDQSKKREIAINKVLWNEQLKTWKDFDIQSGKFQTDYMYPTDLTPIWSDIECLDNPNIIINKYEKLLKSHASGVPSSNINSEQQWDFPNVWAPYHDWMVQLMLKTNRTNDAIDIAQRFVSTVYCGWLKSNNIYEKYNADKLGAYGEGGEYVVQEGFGWTNGVVMKFINMFPQDLKTPDELICNNSSNKTNYSHLNYLIFLLFILIIRLY